MKDFLGVIPNCINNITSMVVDIEHEQSSNTNFDHCSYSKYVKDEEFYNESNFKDIT